MSSRNSKAPQAPTPGNIQALLDHVLVICREGGELTFREPSSERGGLPISERPRSGRPEDERVSVGYRPSCPILARLSKQVP